MKQTKRIDLYNYILFPLLTILYLASVLLPSTYRTKRSIEKQYKAEQEIEFLIQKEYQQKEIIEKLPDDFEHSLSLLGIEPSYEHLVTLLNYGYVFMSEDTKEKERATFYNLIKENRNIYLSCNTISYYLKSKEQKQKTNSIEKRNSNNFRKNMIVKEEQNYSLTPTVTPFYRTKKILELYDYRDINIQLEECPYSKSLMDLGQNESKYLRTLILLNTLIEIDTLKRDSEIRSGYILKAIDNKTYIGIHFSKDSSLPTEEGYFGLGYDILPKQQELGTVRIPVLMYHHINTAPAGSNEFREALYVSPDIFEKQIAYLTRKNYRSISSEEFFGLLSGGINPEQKTVMITFDDATETHYQTAYPILRKYQHTGVFFVPSQVGLLNQSQLTEMHLNLMDIQSHSATHPDLRRVRLTSVLSEEILGSKQSLESLIGKEIKSFAYPGCVGNYTVFKMVENSGYNLGFSCGTSIDHSIDNRVILSRRQVTNSLERLVEILSGF